MGPKKLTYFVLLEAKNVVSAHAAFYGFNLDSRKSLETGCDHLLNYQRWFYKVLLASNSAQTFIYKKLTSRILLSFQYFARCLNFFGTRVLDALIFNVKDFVSFIHQYLFVTNVFFLSLENLFVCSWTHNNPRFI